MAFTIEQEQKAFEQQFDVLYARAPNTFVLMKEGEPIAFHQNYQAAFADGIERFGPTETFLVGHLAKKAPANISLAWQMGVMFG